MKEQKKVFSDKMIPLQGSQVVKGRDGREYILINTGMYTGMQHSQAEHSEFFLFLKRHCVIVGRICPSCEKIDIPPAKLRCPSCHPLLDPKAELQQIGFREMVLVEMSDRGFLEATPPVVCFAPANFKSEVPYANGYVRLYIHGKEKLASNGAMKIRMRTTTGLMRPGIAKWKDEVKIVFCDEREGSIRDIYAVPASELSKAQLEKSPLFESDIAWKKDSDYSAIEVRESLIPKKIALISEFISFAYRIGVSGRARKDLANWESSIRVVTGGGTFVIHIENGNLRMEDADIPDPDIIFRVEDPNILRKYLDDGHALTNLFLEGELQLNVLNETIFKLDRIPRSLKRDGK